MACPAIRWHRLEGEGWPHCLKEAYLQPGLGEVASRVNQGENRGDRANAGPAFVATKTENGFKFS